MPDFSWRYIEESRNGIGVKYRWTLLASIFPFPRRHLDTLAQQLSLDSVLSINLHESLFHLRRVQAAARLVGTHGLLSFLGLHATPLKQLVLPHKDLRHVLINPRLQCPRA